MNIDYVNKWKNFTYIFTYHDAKDFASLWDTKHSFVLTDDSNQIFLKYELPSTRACFGIVTIPEKNLFIYIHYKYVENFASVVIDFYKINDDFTVIKVKDYVIQSGYSCGEISGRICKIQKLFSE